MASIRMEDVRKTYAGGHAAVRGVDLSAADGELLVLVGPSGCGKSTLLRIVAGLETPTVGRVLLDGDDVTRRSPQERDLAMVFQSYALYPHKSVRDNLAFGLRMRDTAKDEIARRIEEVARRLGIEELLDRKPAQLSGGQRQRVAVGRAIVRRPKAFLLDEPLSNLDARMRAQARAELARLHHELGATMLYVTHDQEEAMTLGTRIAVMRAGVVEQVAPPLEVYHRPATAFVAEFVGSPAMNLTRGEVGEGGTIVGAGFQLPIGAALPPGRAVLVGARPQDLEIVAEEADVRGRVDVVEALGSSVLAFVTVGEAIELRVLVAPERAPQVDDVVGLRFRRDRVHLFDAERGLRL